MVGPKLKRHSSGPVHQVSGYIDACYALDPELIAAEYNARVVSAPTRSSGYIVEHDTSRRKAGSRRSEELLAHRMFLAGSTIAFRDWHPVKIVDFQLPLNAVQGDGMGKVDLLGYGRGLCVVELKILGGDTPLNALLEAVGFCASVLIRSGASPVLVARQLGHSSPRVTLDIYSHLFPSGLGDMAVRLDGIRGEAIATHTRHAETKPVTTLPHETSETGS